MTKSAATSPSDTTPTIVGVVSDVRRRSLETAARPEMLVPFEPAPIPLLTFVLRTNGDPAALGPSARERIRALDAKLPVFAVRTMEEVLSESLAGRRVALSLLSLFAAIGLAMAAVGVYGVDGVRHGAAQP
jgi:putative ABC transport system permease protein